MILAFFTLTTSYRLSLFKQIHEIVFHSNGGYDWHTVYNMPIWLRNFTFHEMKSHFDAQAEAQNGESNMLTNTTSGEELNRIKSLSRPDIPQSGTIMSKAPKS